ncbi:MAG: SPOR domain-containing protein [Chitinophagales bacterium]
MRTKTLFLVLCSLVLSVTIQAQELSKEEKKALVKEAKAMKKNPELLKNLKDQAAGLDIVVNEQTAYIMRLTQLNQSLTAKNDALRSSLSDTELELHEKEDDCVLDEAGQKYRIQIGLYRDFNITSYLVKPKFMVFEKVGDLYRYSIGNFDTEEDAKDFAKEIRAMGISDAFVTEYNDGDRNMVFDANNSAGVSGYTPNDYSSVNISTPGLGEIPNSYTDMGTEPVVIDLSGGTVINNVDVEDATTIPAPSSNIEFKEKKSVNDVQVIPVEDVPVIINTTVTGETSLDINAPDETNIELPPVKTNKPSNSGIFISTGE